MGPWSSPPGLTARWTSPRAPKRLTSSVSSSISRRVAPPIPGAVMPFTRPPDASASSNTRKPLAGVPSGATSTDPRSYSSIPKRRSGLSDPNRSIASSYSKTGNGISRIGRSGAVARVTPITMCSMKALTVSSSTKLISRSSWVNSGCRSPRMSSSRKQRAIWK